MVEGPAAALGFAAALYRHDVQRDLTPRCRTRHRVAAAAVDAGALFTLAPGKGILAHREADGVLHAYVALTKPEHWASDLATDGQTRARVMAEFRDWAPGLTALISESETPLIFRPIHALPIEH